METIIRIEHLVKTFKTGSGSFTALDDISLSFNKGEFAGLVGPSGSGKTTLLNIIGSLDTPSSGLVEVLGQSVSKWVGLTDKAKSRPAQLSGGESQRVSIARAMVKRPAIVLADEPSANLDARNSHNIVQTMKKLNAELKTTFIFSTHDEKVMQYLDRIVNLRDGKLEGSQVTANTH